MAYRRVPRQRRRRRYSQPHPRPLLRCFRPAGAVPPGRRAAPRPGPPEPVVSTESGGGGIAALTAPLRPRPPPPPRYVARTSLSCTRVKIRGAQPELIAAGYRERIAEVVAAAGQQLEGVYVRRGCIELIMDAHVSQAAAGVDATELGPAAERHGGPVRCVDVDELVQSLRLPPPEQSTLRSHTAAMWQLPTAAAPPAAADGDSRGGAPPPALTSDGDAAVPTITARPCVVYGSAYDSLAPYDGMRVPAAEPVVDTALGDPSHTAPAAAAAAAQAAAAAAGATGAAPVAMDSGSCCCSLAVQVWAPLPPGEAGAEDAAAAEPPALSARVGGAFLPVRVDWMSVRSVGLVGGAPGAAGAALPHMPPGAAAAPSPAVAATSPSRGRGCLFSGTCHIRDLPVGAGLLLLQATSCPGGSGAAAPGLPRETRPAPVLFVDDPRVATEIQCAAGGGDEAFGGGEEEEDRDADAFEGFVIDLAIFLSAVQRHCAAGAAAGTAADAAAGAAVGAAAGVAAVSAPGCSPLQDLLELQALGEHLEEWLCRAAGGVECWPSTLARLRRDLGTVSSRMQPVGGQEGGGGGDESGLRPLAPQAVAAAAPLQQQQLLDSPRGGGSFAGEVAAEGRGGGLDLAAAATAAVGVSGGGGASSSSSAAVGLSLTSRREHGLKEAPTAGAGGRGLGSAAAAAAAGGSGRSTWREWFGSAARVGAGLYDTYGSCLMEPGYQQFLTNYCALQAPVIDAMFFVSVGGILLRTWQEEPAWRTRPAAAFLAHVAPCLLTLTTSLLTTLLRPLLPRPAWAALTKGCMPARYLTFFAGLLLIGCERCGTAVPPAVAAYHRRGASVMMGEGLVMAATVVIMPASAALLAALRIPIHVRVWVRVGAYDTAAAALPYAVVLALCSVATNLLLHVVLLAQYCCRRQRAAALAARDKSE